MDLPLLDGEIAEAPRPVVAPPPARWREAPVRVLQIGIGGYIRGHVDSFLLDAMAGDDPRRAIAVQPNSTAVPDALRAQEGLFTEVAVSGTAASPDFRFRVNPAISEAFAAARDWTVLRRRVAALPIDLVAMVVTEKGVQADPADVPFDPGRAPSSAIGKLLSLLHARFETDPAARITVLDTDNVADNSEIVRRSAFEVAERLWRMPAPFVDWLRSRVAFPVSLCDRMVPGTPRDRARLDGFWGLCGYRDLALTAVEPFRMWIIEDRFAGPRPRWGPAGVRFVPDVKAFEAMKLEVLNGAHTGIVHAGFLLGLDFVRESVRHPRLRPYLERLLFDEVVPMIRCPGADPSAFAREALARFGNDQLDHRNYQIAMYGSSKIQDRLVPPAIRFCEERRAVPRAVAMALAILARYLTGERRGAGTDTRGNRVAGVLGRREDGTAFLIDDPRAGRFFETLRFDMPPEARSASIRRWFSDPDILGPGRDLSRYPGFLEAIERRYESILSAGLDETLRRHLAGGLD